ncbi:hypothetical protein L6452_09493 [Arctium lappa]|uniref:Uncharacterized protein n=1 Tax=Arctium lappa TaxID=4217 RepID=A0ACB9DKM5_ARCLA|nr:hypothetical protein L6452_09493 [Arctium lappa]
MGIGQISVEVELSISSPPIFSGRTPSHTHTCSFSPFSPSPPRVYKSNLERESSKREKATVTLFCVCVILGFGLVMADMSISGSF